jgi:hypothetical protein
VPLGDLENTTLSRNQDGDVDGVSLGGTYRDEDENNCDTLVTGGTAGAHLTLYFARNCLVSNFPGHGDYDPDKPIGVLDICEGGGPLWAARLSLNRPPSNPGRFTGGVPAFA